MSSPSGSTHIAARRSGAAGVGPGAPRASDPNSCYHLAVGDFGYTKPSQQVVVDASPLIYLAKLEALDVFRAASLRPLVPRSVFDETAKPALAYRHPDAIRIEGAARSGDLEVVEARSAENEAAEALAVRIPQMHRGECEVLAVASSRGIPAVIHEGRARTIARILGIELLDVAELLFRATEGDELLEGRIRGFAGLVNLRLGDIEALHELVRQRRLR